MIFVDQNSRQYAIKSDDCSTFATDPLDTRYQAYFIGSDKKINESESVSIMKSDIDTSGYIITNVEN
jgi:hypothetical protein